MKSIIFLSITFFSFNLFAQQKITLITTKTDSYKANSNGSSFDRKYLGTSTNINKFTLGDDETVLKIGIGGKNLRKHIQGSEALAVFNKGIRQQQLGIAMIFSGVGGAFMSTRALTSNSSENDTNIIKRITNRPLAIVGTALVFGSWAGNLIFRKKSKDNLRKSVDMHNSSIISSIDSDKIRLDDIGLQWNSQSSRPQLSLSWVF